MHESNEGLIAEERISKYAAAERLERGNFVLVGNQRDANGTQVLDYDYQGVPRQSVRLYIHPGGGVEVSRIMD
jgi:hypothetical protein